LLDEVARDMGVHERELWRVLALHLESLDEALEASMRANIERARRRLAEALPECHRLLGRKGGEPCRRVQRPPSPAGC
jgi:hypothetical protein